LAGGLYFLADFTVRFKKPLRITPTMTKDKIVGLLHDKAKAIGLKYKGIELRPVHEKEAGFNVAGGKMYVDLVDENIVLEVDDVSDCTDKQLEAMIEHEICHCKDTEEEMYGNEVFCPPLEIAQGLCLEIYHAYTDFLACKRQLNVFPYENFVLYQMFGIDEFVRDVDAKIRSTRISGVATVLIYAYFKEQLKCDMLKEDPKIIPEIVSKFTAPFAEAFEMINSSGLDWMAKTRLSCILTLTAYTNIDMPHSYIYNRMILDGKKESLSLRFAENEWIDGKTFMVASRVEDLLLSTYSKQ
jgi:hypothetical protein